MLAIVPSATLHGLDGRVIRVIGDPDRLVALRSCIKPFGVVALLVALVGLSGLSIAILDSWLDRRLPHAVTGRKGPVAFYATVTFMGWCSFEALVAWGLGCRRCG